MEDKIVKYEILDLEKRLNLWREEQLPKEAVKELELAYPKVKQLEYDICSLIGVLPSEIAALA